MPPQCVGPLKGAPHRNDVRFTLLVIVVTHPQDYSVPANSLILGLKDVKLSPKAAEFAEHHLIQPRRGYRDEGIGRGGTRDQEQL